MSFSYKTSPSDAAAMAAVWYGLAGVSNPSPQAIQWWAKQIQQDGSQPAFDNFKNGKGQDAQSKFDPNVLAQNAQKYSAATGLAPYQPSKDVPQFPGTNHKTLLAEAQEPAGNFLKNIAPLAAVIPGVGPLVSGALAAAGQAIIPGANLGDAVKSGVVGAAEGVGAGALGGATGLTSALGNAGISALPSASGANLASMAANGTLAGVADASAPLTGAGVSAVNAAIPSLGGIDIPGVSSVTGGGGSSGGVGGTGLTTADILKLGGSALTAGTNYAENAAQLAERKREFDASNALATQNTAAGEGQIAAQTQAKLNTAPLADQSQYMLKNLLSTPPTAFKPRDYTQPGGTNNLNTPATGGAQAQLAANNAASATYKPGAGGVDTSALQLLLSKLKGSGSAYGTMPTTGGVG